ncbi:unnamed protein product, partial [Didymodactylos carnosus]
HQDLISLLRLVPESAGVSYPYGSEGYVLGIGDFLCYNLFMLKVLTQKNIYLLMKSYLTMMFNVLIVNGLIIGYYDDNDNKLNYSSTKVYFFPAVTIPIAFGSLVGDENSKAIPNSSLKINKSIVIELAIKGILIESKLYIDKETAMKDAEYLTNELRKVQNAKELSVMHEKCIQLYTKESFLYRIINETLRDNNRTKFETLGPFCYLLYNYAGSMKNKQGKLPDKIVLYRGECITSELVEEYKSTLDKKNVIWKWSQFVSTTKQRDVAEKFGGTSDQGVCIASLSEYTAEDEVLLRPGIRFQINRIEEEIGTEEETEKKTFIVH